jgi:Uma2 family endonuclease
MSVITAAPATPIAPSAADVPMLPIYRLSVAQYQAMAEHGILTENDRVELLHGLLVTRMTPRPPHAIAVDLIQEALSAVLPAGWHVRTQAPLQLEDSVPEPDDCVTRGSRRDFRTRHPSASEAGLVIEVADTTLATDRGTKKAMYATANIPLYWIVNLEANQLEVFTDPTGPADQPQYASCQVLGPSEEVSVFLDGREVGRIAVPDLLP